jgi:hypothetical protein
MTGPAHAKNTDESTCEVSEDDLVLEEIFARGMCSMDDVKMGETYVLLNGYPYDATSDGAVVDLGESHGFMAFNTAWQPLELPAPVQNLPKAVVVIEGQLPPNLSDCVSFVTRVS